MKKYVFLTVLAFFLTVSLANNFASEANQLVKTEKKGLTTKAKLNTGPQRSYILADNGTVLTRLYIENREDVPLANVPVYVQNAFIAIEDGRYYEHHGVDFYGIARALMADIQARRVVEGASTITEQYIKNVTGANQITVGRKLREAILAAQLEREFSKQQILEAYLNTIYFGQGAYGVEAASEVFFNKKVSDLTLPEGALLAGVVRSPNGFSPYFHPQEAYQRQAEVLDRMVKLHLISKAEAEAAKAVHPQLVPPKPEPVIEPYFVDYVKQQLINEYGVDKVFKGGLRVYTTLNLKAQKLAEKSVANELDLPNDPQAALVSIIPQNGHIIAMVGGRDYNRNKFNLAVQGRRQPGSSFKPFVLVTALKQGIGPNDTFNSSSPQTFRIGKPGHWYEWTVHNAEGSGSGMMTLRDATVNSVNAVYANVILKVGTQNVVNTAYSMGITTHVDPFPAIGIGGLTTGVSPLEMASAYGTLANNGVHVKPEAIIKITDANGNIIKQTQPQSSQAIDPEIAHRAVDIMKGVIQRGTATRANIGRPAAGKTGTNEAFRDAWFVGFTPNLVTSVWMGYPNAQISMYNVHGSEGFGGIIPASIWHDFMGVYLEGTPATDFPPPNWSPGQVAGASTNSLPNSPNSNNQNRGPLQQPPTTEQPTPPTTLRPTTTIRPTTTTTIKPTTTTERPTTTQQPPVTKPSTGTGK